MKTLNKQILTLLAVLLSAIPHTNAWSQQDGEITRLPEPPMVMNPPRLETRRQLQLKSAAQFDVYHDFQFQDTIRESGITFRHRVVEDSAKTYKAVHYDHGNGIAIADVDNDGRDDILFLTQVGGNELWRNMGQGRFEKMPEHAGIDMSDRISVAASFADIDNDGDADLYITAVREGNRLFENDGSGNFTDITVQSGTGHKGHSSGAVFFDYDRDGLLDLFVTNVGQYTSELVRIAVNDGVEYRFFDGFSDAFSGHLYPKRTEQSVLYRNLGNNRFEDVSEKTGLKDSGWSGDASAADINNDGWPDLYALNMQGHDNYYQNIEGSRFENKSRELFPHTSWGAMGIRVFDWNNDGRMDIFITDMHSDMSAKIPFNKEKLKSEISWDEHHLQSGGMSIYGNTFFEQQADGSFVEKSDQIGAENYWPWGLSTGDLNGDGFQDVFLASSMNYPFRYGVNSVLLNEHGERFRDSEFILNVEPRRNGQTAQAWFTLDCDGIDNQHAGCSKHDGMIEVWGAKGTRSSVIFDMDDDGDLDIITNEFNASPMVLTSNLSAKKEDLHYLKIRLKGSRSNRSAIGARVQVSTDKGTYVQVMDGKSGYLSQSLQALYFGLGDAASIEEIKVTWPSGKQQTVASATGLNTSIVIEES